MTVSSLKSFYEIADKSIWVEIFSTKDDKSICVSVACEMVKTGDLT